MSSSARFLAVYGIGLVVGAFVAAECFTVSMDEPYKVVTQRELIWQLVAPSSLLTAAVMGILALVYASIYRIIRFLYAVPLGVGTLCLAAVSIESILGYLWDLRVHAGIA